MRFIVDDNIKYCGLIIRALKFTASSSKLSLITTPKRKLFVKVPFGSKKRIYFSGWKNRPPSAWRNPSPFMINESSGNVELQISNCLIKHARRKSEIYKRNSTIFCVRIQEI